MANSTLGEGRERRAEQQRARDQLYHALRCCCSARQSQGGMQATSPRVPRKHFSFSSVKFLSRVTKFQYTPCLAQTEVL